jgi:hypothetical protein
MLGDHGFELPSELDLIAFFGAEPVVRAPEDGYWCFELVDERGVKLRFSFNSFERSVQTEVSLGSIAIDTVSHELANRLRLDVSALEATFGTGTARTTLRLTVTPVIELKWSTLRCE